MNAFTRSSGRIAFGGFLLLAASLAVQKPSAGVFAGQALSATDILFPLVFLCFVAAVFLGSIKLVWKPVYWFLAAYIGTFAIASLFAPDRGQAAVKTFATVYLVFLAVLVMEVVDNVNRLKLAIAAFLIASAIPVLLGIFTVALFYLSPGADLLPYLTSHYGAVPVGNYPRLSSTFVSASMYCNYLNVVVMILLLTRANGWIGRRLFLLTVAAAIISAFFTISSGLGALFFAVGLWIWYTHRKTVRGRLALAVSIAVCVLFLTTGFVALQSHSTSPYSFTLPFIGKEAYPSPRLLVWTEAMKNFLDNFWFGAGPGSRSAGVMFQNSEGTYSYLTDAHNTFLSVATQTGVFGLLALIALSSYLLIEGFRRRDNVTTFGLAIAFLSTFVIQGLMGSFEDARHICFLIGLLAALIRIQRMQL